jgi:hypothetical protein
MVCPLCVSHHSQMGTIRNVKTLITSSEQIGEIDSPLSLISDAVFIMKYVGMVLPNRTNH